jgi:asparagine synthase (glutamine-hydrolysing)
MCGIAGYIDYKGDFRDTDCFEKIMLSLKRRGPDQDGIYTAAPAVLIHTRLSVVDLEHGRQPMMYEHGGRRLIMVYNGELYNTEELRQKLLYKGYSFIGHSDTEVLLKAYAEWGESCTDMLNGIYAFAVWDEEEERLFMARDRIGVKPFFYYAADGVFIFASELKALLEHPSVKPEIDAQGIAEIILVGPGRTPGCGVFKNIEELKPGCCGFYDKAGLRIKQYWALKDKEHTDNFEQTAEKVRFLVEDAIERQLVSDVPICTFLSGGLDSSIISTIAAKRLADRGERLDTFSVHYRDNEKYFTASKFQPGSDDEYIDLLSNHIGSRHHKVIVDTDMLVEALYSAVDARDLPGMADVDSSLLLFCGEVKKSATVALSGECADEIFGGYPWYRDETVREAEGFPWAQSTKYRAGFLKDAYLSVLQPEDYVNGLYLQTVKGSSKLPNLSPLERRMREMVNLNFNWFMQTLLDRKDRMSMYHGLEVRVPFCDYRIAEYLYSVPWEFKDYQGREKGLLRKAVEGLLPEKILWRKKSPYPKTHNPAYLKAVSQKLSEIINNPASPLLQIVKKEELEKLLLSDRSTPWYGQLMTTPQTIAYFIQVNYWLKKYRVRLI